MRHQPSIEAVQSYGPSTTVYEEDDRPGWDAERNNPLGRHTIHNRGMDFDAPGNPKPPVASSRHESERLDGSIPPDCGFSEPQQATND